jgi:hypothetical protein
MCRLRETLATHAAPTHAHARDDDAQPRPHARKLPAQRRTHAVAEARPQRACGRARALARSCMRARSRCARTHSALSHARSARRTESGGCSACSARRSRRCTRRAPTTSAHVTPPPPPPAAAIHTRGPLGSRAALRCAAARKHAAWRTASAKELFDGYAQCHADVLNGRVAGQPKFVLYRTVICHPNCVCAALLRATRDATLHRTHRTPLARDARTLRCIVPAPRPSQVRSIDGLGRAGA